MTEANVGRMLGRLVLPVALLGAVPGVPWAIGRGLESRLQEYREPFMSTVPWLHISSRRYEQGVFSSREELDIEIAVGADPQRFTIINEVQHGPIAGFGLPVLARVRSTLRLQGSADVTARELFGDVSPLTVVTRLGLLGGGHSEVTVPQLDTRMGPARAHVVWRGFKGEFDFTGHMDRLDAKASAPLLRVESPQGDKMELLGLVFSTNGRRVFSDLYAGSVAVKLDSIKASGAGGLALNATGVSYFGEVPVDGEFVDVIARIGAEKAKISGMDYGPAHYDISFRHLHAPTLMQLTHELQRVSEKLRVSKDAALASFDDAALQSAFRQLLLAKPRLVIDRISATSPQGPFSVKGEAHFTDLHSSDLSQPSLLSLLPKLEAQADLSVPAAWATQGARVLPRGAPSYASAVAATEELNVDELKPGGVVGGGVVAAPMPTADNELDELVRRGFVERKGDLVSTHIEYRQGKLLLNGRSFGE